MSKTKSNVLSIFIDESGDTGIKTENNSFYIVSFVLHNQSINISSNLNNLYLNFNKIGLSGNASFHCGPLIRREEAYIHTNIDERKKIFNEFFNFTKKLNFEYTKIIISKEKNKNNELLIDDKILDFMRYFLINYEKVKYYSKINIYYDDGQKHLTKTIRKIITEFSGYNIDFRNKSNQNHYRLLQVADLIATMELLNSKEKFSSSEKDFFESKRQFKKRYYKLLSKKQIEI